MLREKVGQCKHKDKRDSLVPSLSLERKIVGTTAVTGKRKEIAVYRSHSKVKKSARISASTRKRKILILCFCLDQTRFHGEIRARKFVFMLAYVCASDLTESQAVIKNVTQGSLKEYSAMTQITTAEEACNCLHHLTRSPCRE